MRGTQLCSYLLRTARPWIQLQLSFHHLGEKHRRVSNSFPQPYFQRKDIPERCSSSSGCCLVLAHQPAQQVFLCGLGAKNGEQEPKTAQKMAQVREQGGVGKKGFLPSPPPPPSFIFWLSFHFSRCQNRESPSSLFFCSETKRKRLLRRLLAHKPLVKHEIRTTCTRSINEPLSRETGLRPPGQSVE